MAQRVPLERMLIETDSPYLAPMPYRGKMNQPPGCATWPNISPICAMSRWKKNRGRTTANFFKLFNKAGAMQ